MPQRTRKARNAPTETGATTERLIMRDVHPTIAPGVRVAKFGRAKPAAARQPRQRQKSAIAFAVRAKYTTYAEALEALRQASGGQININLPLFTGIITHAAAVIRTLSELTGQSCADLLELEPATKTENRKPFNSTLQAFRVQLRELRTLAKSAGVQLNERALEASALSINEASTLERLLAESEMLRPYIVGEQHMTLTEALATLREMVLEANDKALAATPATSASPPEAA